MCLWSHEVSSWEVEPPAGNADPSAMLTDSSVEKPTKIQGEYDRKGENKANVSTWLQLAGDRVSLPYWERYD